MMKGLWISKAGTFKWEHMSKITQEVGGANLALYQHFHSLQS